MDACLPFFAVPPRIEDGQSSSDKVRTEGSDVVLECHASGSPTPLVTWKREDNSPINIDKANNITGKFILAAWRSNRGCATMVKVEGGKQPDFHFSIRHSDRTLPHRDERICPVSPLVQIEVLTNKSPFFF